MSQILYVPPFKFSSDFSKFPFTVIQLIRISFHFMQPLLPLPIYPLPSPLALSHSIQLFSSFTANISRSFAIPPTHFPSYYIHLFLLYWATPLHCMLITISNPCYSIALLTVLYPLSFITCLYSCISLLNRFGCEVGCRRGLYWALFSLSLFQI